MPDWGLDDDFPPAETNDARPAERELVPEGDHEFQIKQVIDHGDSVEVRLAHDDRRFGWVFARIPKDRDWGKRILSTLRMAVDMTREEWAAAPITDLAGRRVMARIYHRAGTGRTFVNVGQFITAPAAVETATTRPTVERAVAPPSSRTSPPARRTPTQKADTATSAPDDDIPF